MKELTMRQIGSATCGRVISGNDSETVKKICTDSRKSEPGDLFFALIGENHDAHKYLEQVAQAGCRCAVISDEAACPEGMTAVLVDDTTKALQDLAAWYLEELDIRKIAVTGSTGKTSTRDLTWYVCSEKYKAQKNVGNLNNHLGVPLTILSFDEDTEVGILEMGMDKFGEIE
ncbi:MAG: UDP-N-acetylmuramoyl-tripeptide--D-alanyl-D-alanine ligase, partial [Firmicutes bacterium]|nr:UDP-N-acetylmuramoyl-tripeptide--D-alanyl-D-alanine ligase [Bacillota bacterium]